MRWITQRLSFTDLRDLYARAAIVALPLRERPHAGGVSALLEAAAMGRPMVVSASSGVLDWAIDGRTCRTVPCGDAAAMAAALRALGERTTREALGAGARAFVEAECTAAAFAARLARALRLRCAPESGRT